MKERDAKIGLKEVLTGKWMIFSTVIAGMIRIIYALIRGRDMVDAIGISVTGLLLTLGIYLIFRPKGKED
jgi:hypothetical protein